MLYRISVRQLRYHGVAKHALMTTSITVVHVFTNDLEIVQVKHIFPKQCVGIGKSV